RPTTARRSWPEMMEGSKPSTRSFETRPDSFRETIRISRSRSPRKPAALSERVRSPALMSAVHSGAPPHASSGCDGRYDGSSEPGHTAEGTSVRLPHDAE